MTTTLADTRDMTLAHACAIFKEIALTKKRIAYQTALTEKRIACIKEKHEETIEGLVARLGELEPRLTTFIQGNPELFKRPRAHKTDFGRFGMERVSNVEITDEEQLIDFAKSRMERDHDDIFEVKTVLKKGAVGKRLRAGQLLPGAKLQRGERAFYKVDNALLEEARSRASA